MLTPADILHRYFRDDIAAGWRPNQTGRAYLAGPGLGGSGLRRAERSGAHWLARELNPTEPSATAAAAMALGTAAHLAILQPELWDDHYAPAFDLRNVSPLICVYRTAKEVAARLAELGLKKSGSKSEVIQRLRLGPEPTAVYVSELAADHAREHTGRTFLSADDEALVWGMRDAVHRWHDEWVADGGAPLLGGATEQSAYWIDPESDILCRMRVDAVSPCRRIFLDLKTTADASPEGFSPLKSGYHFQLAHYLAGCAALHDGWMPGWRWLVVERTPPHGVYLHEPSAALIGYALRQRRVMLDRIAAVLREPRAPAYPIDVNYIDVPAWRLRVEEEAT